MNRKTYALALLGAVAMLAIAGCGGGSDNNSGSSNASASSGYGGGGATTKEEAMPGAESGVAVITVSNAKGVGPVLVNHDGFTVYDFHKDKGTTSSCYGACAQAWPPVLSEGSPTAGEGAMAGKLGTTERKDGTTQVTYAGHPLYTFVDDQKPGEATGNDVSAFGGQWYALKGNGEEAGD